MAVLISLISIFRLTQSAFSAPVTSTAKSKLTVYQGVATIVPGGAGDSLLEFGNAGRDIAGTGSIFIRPDFLNNGTANYAQFYKDASDRVSLRIPGSLTSGTIIRHPVGQLAAAATQAKRYEVARIGYDQINWSNNSSVFVELYQKYWDAGGYKKYEVRAGYTDDGSYRLVDATGLSSTMTEVRVRIGARVLVSAPNIFYLPVYVDVDNYTGWDVTISHNMAETSSGTPVASQLRIFDNPTGANVASFTENDIVINNFTNKFTGQNTTNEGGEIQLEGAPIGSPDWNFDVYDSDAVAGGSGATDEQLRIHSNGQVKLAITQTNGNVYLPSGQLCFGAVGSTDCASSWAGTPNLHNMLGAGNTSDRSASFGSFTAPTAKLVVNNNTAGAGSAGDAIAAYANTGNAAIFGQQDSTSSTSSAGAFIAPNVTGFAAGMYASAGTTTNAEGIGVFARHEYVVPSGDFTAYTRAGLISGDLDIYQSSIAPVGPLSWGYIGDVAKVLANVPGSNDPNVTGFPLHVDNLNANGFAGRFYGGVLISGAPANCSGACTLARATLDIRNRFTSGSNISATALKTTGGYGGIGLDAYGGSIAVQSTGAGAGTFAAQFNGTTLVEGRALKKANASAPALDIATVARIRYWNGSSWVETEEMGGCNNLLNGITCTEVCGGVASEDGPLQQGQCLGALPYTINTVQPPNVITHWEWCGFTAFTFKDWGGSCQGVMRCLCR